MSVWIYTCVERAAAENLSVRNNCDYFASADIICSYGKAEAEAVLASIGLTSSNAFRMMMTQIEKEKMLPFELLVPNDETIEAMKAARHGELAVVGSADNLLDMLNEGDYTRVDLSAITNGRERGRGG